MEVGDAFEYLEEEWEILCSINVEAGWELARAARPNASYSQGAEAHVWREREGVVVMVKSGNVVAVVSAVNRLLLCRRDTLLGRLTQEREYGRNALPSLVGAAAG